MRASDLFKSTKKQTVAEGENSYGYKVGQTVKLSNGKQGRVLDIFDDSIEVLLTNGRTITVDFRDARVLDEAGLGDVRARMAASRNPTTVKPAATAAQTATDDSVYKVGDNVDFGVGVPKPKVVQQGTITAIQRTPYGMVYTVKTADGQARELNTMMKSLYMVPTKAASTVAEADPGSIDLPRATMSRGQNKTTGLPLIHYNGKSYGPPESPYTKSPEGATGTRVLVPAAAFGIRSLGDVVALLGSDGTAYAEQPIKVFNPMGRKASTQGLGEADDWEEDTEKHRRFIEYAKKTLMRERDPKRRIESANYLSKQENKFFGSPISSAEEQTPFGSVNTGKAFTDLIKGIMSDIQSGNLHYEQQALSAAIWLEPEGKKFLKTAHDDFIKMMDYSRKEREQHAIALSGYQIANLGGRVVGSLKGGIVNDPTASMTPEILGVHEMAEQEILRKKGEREDEEDRQRNIAMWNALPMPLKIAAAAAVGKTPAQLEKILFAKNEIEAVGGLDTSDFPNLQQNASDTEQPETKTKPVAEGAEQMTPNWAKYVLDQLYNSNGDVTMTDLFDEGIPGLRAMFMDTAQEHGLDPDEDFMDVEHEVIVKLENFVKGGHELDEGDKIGNMPADKFDAAMARLKHLAGAGPLKTVWDPQKRVYKNMPTAVQPKK